jgi:hypothetical protein
MTQRKTRAKPGGPFFKDYQRSVRIPKSWSNGDGWLINFVGHPVRGAASSHIRAANDPRGRDGPPRRPRLPHATLRVPEVLTRQ